MAPTFNWMIKIVKVNKLCLNFLLVSIVNRVSRSGTMKYQCERKHRSVKNRWRAWWMDLSFMWISINLFKFFSLLFFKYYCFTNDLIFSIFRNFHSIRDSIRWIELIYDKEAQNKGICLMYKDPTQPGEILPCRVNGSDVWQF